MEFKYQRDAGPNSRTLKCKNNEREARAERKIEQMELKYLTEKRAENQEEMQDLLNAAKLDKRALTEDEISKFNELKKLITEIDATINAEEEAREMNIEEKKKEISENERRDRNSSRKSGGTRIC